MGNYLRSLLANIDREAWQRFFLAVGGLSLAFAAAVFSSVAREKGNVLATAAFATSALVLALVVGVMTVPFLARRVAAARVRDAFDYELTREGMAYLGLAVLIGIAALNTANNLLFIVLAAMLAAVGVSGVASAAVLRRLELELVAPQNAFAMRPVTLRVNLHNPRLWMPAFSVKIFSPSDKKKKRPGWEWRKTEFVFPKQNSWMRLPDYTLGRKVPPPHQAKILTRPVYFTFVAPRSTAGIEVEVLFSRRGQYTQDGFSVAEDERRLRLVFDNPVPGQVSPPAYEHAVSLAASLACHFSSENIDLSFAGTGYEGGNNLEDFLRYLAVIQPAKPQPGAEGTVLDSLPVSTDYNVILSPCKPGSLPSALWHSSYVIYM